MFGAKKGAVKVNRARHAINKSDSEVYLRSDMGCGCIACTACLKTSHAEYAPVLESTAATPLLIPDANVVLHNTNVLEDPRVTNVVLLTSVLNEVMERNKSVYLRINRIMRDLSKHFFVFSNEHHEATYTKRGDGESAADYNARCLRVAAHWYTSHLVGVEPTTTAVLVSHDAGLKTACEGYGIATASLSEYLQQAVGEDCDLLEKLEVEHKQSDAQGQGQGQGAAGKPTGPMFTEYVEKAALLRGIDEGLYFKGKIKVSETSCFFGEVRGRFEGRPFDRILVPGKRNMNRAIHADIVAVELLPIPEWKKPASCALTDEQLSAMTDDEAVAAGIAPCARVVGIVQMQRRPFCGSIATDDAEATASLSGQASVLFQPKSNRIPKIRIQTKQVADLRDKRLAVVIDDWPVTSSAPYGHYIEVLGKIGDKDTEAKVILIENDIPHYDFSAAVYDCLPKGKWAVEPEEEAKRLDLRFLPICSVDPLGCKDIDDALHFRVLPNGNREVGVHIADVTHFMKEHTAMDDEAKKRSTSVYLVDRRIDMLPKLLTENLCSIVEGDDRYAMSIIWEFDENLKVVRDWFGKTIIRSRKAYYYGHAQAAIDDPNDTSELTMSLRGLMEISRVLKAKRVEAGALILASQEFKFKIDNDHVSPTDMMQYQTFEANSMIEEWMLYANVAAAKRIYQSFPRWALLRRHQPPGEASLDALNEALFEKHGFKLDYSTSLKLNESLNRCIDLNDPFFNNLVRMLTTRCLRQAEYFSSGEVPSEEFHHYGLAMEIYTHFTSPIRRYADVTVHRQLCAALKIAEVSQDHTDPVLMREVAENINYRHEQAQRAGRDSQNLYTGFYLRSLSEGGIPLQDGYVVRVTDTHISVLIAKYGQEGRIAKEDIRLKTKPADAIRLFDRVSVRIQIKQAGDVLRSKMEFQVVDPDDVAAEVASDEAKKKRRTE